MVLKKMVLPVLQHARVLVYCPLRVTPWVGFHFFENKKENQKRDPPTLPTQEIAVSA